MSFEREQRANGDGGKLFSRERQEIGFTVERPRMAILEKEPHSWRTAELAMLTGPPGGDAARSWVRAGLPGPVSLLHSQQNIGRWRAGGRERNPAGLVHSTATSHRSVLLKICCVSWRTSSCAPEVRGGRDGASQLGGP